MIRRRWAAPIGALFCAAVLTAAATPAHAFRPNPEPDAPHSHSDRRGAAVAQADQDRRGPKGAQQERDRRLEPRRDDPRSERFRQYRPENGKRGQDKSREYKPNQFKPDQYKPNQYKPNQYRPGEPPRQERAPSQLYPRDERDRRVLQQMMPHDRARRAVEQGQIRPLNEIRGQVRQQFNGRIVGIELYENQRGGRNSWLYDVRVLTKKGDVMAVEMDARTGRVMSVRGQR